jgi:hypothetical protein
VPFQVRVDLELGVALLALERRVPWRKRQKQCIPLGPILAKGTTELFPGQGQVVDDTPVWERRWTVSWLELRLA